MERRRMNENGNEAVWLCIMLDQGEEEYGGECVALCFAPNALRHLLWKSEQADRHAERFSGLFPGDYLEWGTLDVDCVAVEWGALVGRRGFGERNGRGGLRGELPTGRRPVGYAKATKRNDQAMLCLSFTDADDHIDWAMCSVGNLVRWVEVAVTASGMRARKALSRETVRRLATLYEYGEGGRMAS